MGWAKGYIERLRKGEIVEFRPRGGSMSGRIEDGQLVTVVPGASEILHVGDVVLCTVGGRDYLHLVKSIGADGRYQIGNNRGRINGWCTRKQIHGKVTQIHDDS